MEIQTLQDKIIEKARKRLVNALDDHFSDIERFNTVWYGDCTLAEFFREDAAKENLEHCTLRTLIKALRERFMNDHLAAYIEEDTRKILDAVKELERIMVVDELGF